MDRDTGQSCIQDTVFQYLGYRGKCCAQVCALTNRRSTTSHTGSITSHISAFHTTKTLNQMHCTKITTWFIALQRLVLYYYHTILFIDHAETY